MKNLIVFALFYLALGQGISIAQQSYQLSAEDGLRGNSVWRAIQDSQGYLWFGTDNGLIRYNGKGFTTLTTADGLLGESITSLLLVNDSTLIAASYKQGLNVVNTNSLKVVKSTRLAFIGESLLEHDGKLFDLLSGANVMVGTWPDLEMDSYFLDSGKKAYPRMYSFYSNDLVGVENGQLIRYEKKGASKLFDDQEEELFVTTIDYFQRNNWVGGDGFIAQFNDQGYTKKVTQGIPKDGRVHRIWECKDGKIWLSVINYGLYLVENNVAQSYGEKLGIGTSPINSFFEDHNQNLWILTTGSGAICLPKTNIRNFYSEHLQIGEANDFVYQNELGMLAATSLGILSLDNYAFQALPKIRPADVESIAGHGATYVHKIDTDFNGDIFAVTPDYEGIDGMIEFNSVKLNYVLSLFLDRSRKKVLSHTRLRDKNVARFNNKPIWIENGQRVNYLMEAPLSGKETYVDGNGNLWSNVKDKGIIFSRIDRTNSKVESKTALKNTSFYSALNYKGNELFGTNLGIYNLHADSLHYSELNELLPDKTIKALELDVEGGLWIATDNGLAYYDGAEMRNWNTSDGLISNQINALGYHPKEKTLYIGYDAGISILNIEKFLNSMTTEIPVRFTAFSSRGVDFDQNETIELAPESNDVEISFSSLDYSKKDGKRFQYRLNSDEERKWRNTSNTTLEFNSLASADYTLEVRPILRNGRAGNTSTLNFSIDKVLYKKTWFILLMAALGSLGASIYLRYRLKQQEKEQERERVVEQKIKSLEYQALSAMMNPHFIFNSLNSIQYFYNSKDLRSANDYLAQFAKLIRMNLDMADRATVVLEDELDRLELYLELEQMRLGDVFDYKIDIDPDIDPDGILVPSMIIQPYVENSIFHGIRANERYGHISIHIKPKPENYVIISITDNGIGINRSKADKSKLNANHESKAMRINQERINIIGRGDQESQITVEELVDPDGTVRGTQVNIIIPDQMN